MLTAVVASCWCNIKTFPSLYVSNFKRNEYDIINLEVNKDLVADSIINIATECVAFGVKSVFISSLTVNTLLNFVFINAINKTLKATCVMHNFHFIDHSNIKKEHFWEKALHFS